MMATKSYADRVSWAVFLIGLGVLFTPLGRIVGGFFPGILFVAGAATLAYGIARGQTWYTVSGAMWMFVLGFVFLFGFSLPLLLVLVGLAVLFGFCFKQGMCSTGKRKNEDILTDKPKHDEFV
jgi:hypothetical protein